MTRCHILLVEDEPDIRDSLKEILEMEGYEVVAVANGKEALDYLRRGHMSCLILLDLMMPVMNGWQFLETFKRELQLAYSRIPIVVVSAAADVTELRSNHSCEVMTKPCDISQVLTLAQAHCNG